MKNSHLRLKFVVSCLGFVLVACAPTFKDQAVIDGFIDRMVVNHHFDKPSLTELFAEIAIREDILNKISTPAEGLPWYKYRKIFLKENRIKAGVQFWHDHTSTLASVEKDTGVPAALIVAIIGVETQFGMHTGNYRVIDALSTLAFNYPPRSQFFASELKNFLLLCRDEHVSPLAPTGSYAGAMGIPQFMPSSYIKYAIDFNRDKYRDIWHNPSDAIASVGNYFVKHGWQKGQNVAVLLRDGVRKTDNHFSFLKENLRFIKSNDSNPNISKPLLQPQKARVIAFEQENGEELWAPSENFYVITRYNKSPLYAMAVFQLSLAISNQRVSSRYEQNHYNTTYTGVKQLLE